MVWTKPGSAPEKIEEVILGLLIFPLEGTPWLVDSTVNASTCRKLFLLTRAIAVPALLLGPGLPGL